MTNRVLVLNQDYSPMTVCSVERAFLLIYLKKAELLNAVESKSLRSVNATFPFPSVIKINRYVNMPYMGVVLTRQNIFRRDGHKCQYCGTHKDLTLDHLIPRSKGGKSTWNNLLTACRRCNARKGDYQIDQIDMKPKTMPHKPSYVMFLMDSSGQLQEEWKAYLKPHLKTKIVA
ncbi:MAG: HNH endonuclease [Cyclobacteriaceae bacterium]